MKWDLKTLTSLYLVALAISPEIRSLRDLRKRHLVMLRAIKREASAAVHKRWGLDQGALRFFVHYQPSYCVPTTSRASVSLMMDMSHRSLSCARRKRELRRDYRVNCRTSPSFGRPDISSMFNSRQVCPKADCITKLELDPDDGPSILERMTFTYGLGDNHGLFSGMKAAQNSVLDN